MVKKDLAEVHSDGRNYNIGLETVSAELCSYWTDTQITAFW